MNAFTTCVLVLQLFLGVWQIIKLTPVGAILRCLAMRCLLQPFGLSSYAHLKTVEGNVYKKVRCHVIVDDMGNSTPNPHPGRLHLRYLGDEFLLERKEGAKLFVNGTMAYYITDKSWASLHELEKASKTTVFIKGYKEFWQSVVTGGAMEFTQVLDALILEDKSILQLDNMLLLPVDLTVSEEKLLKLLNLIGLFLQTRQVYWLLPPLSSLVSAILEFCTPLRVLLYSKITLVFCRMVQLITDKLSRSPRIQIYSLGKWIEHLQPCNDMELKVVRGDICVVIAGGAKTSNEEATLVADQDEDTSKLEVQFISEPRYGEGELKVTAEIFQQGTCKARARTIGDVELGCTPHQFVRLKTFLSCVAKHRSGSLKVCASASGGGNVVQVRGFRRSVISYANNGFPQVYELQLKDALVR